jgi:hypothetical protein
LTCWKSSLTARLRQNQRDDAEAARRYEQALAALADLHRHSPQVVEFQERLALVQMDHGTFQMRRRNAEAALAAYTIARDLLQPIVPAPDSVENSERRRNYAVALRELARVQLDLKQAVAEPQLKLSQQYLERLIEQAKDTASRNRLEGDLEQTKQVQLKMGKS